MRQAIPQIDNSDAYHTISWIMSNADMGFYIVIASSHMQRKIAEKYISSRVAIYDYTQNAKPYSYADISDWVKSHESEDIYFILNMQLAFMEEADLISDENMLSFNMSRDLLANQQKIWIFYMTDEAEYRLSTFAYDIYSYVRQKAYFLDEEESDFEGAQILDFDEYPDYAKIEATLARYKNIEKQCMDLPLDGTPNARLLSAAVTLSNIASLYMECAQYKKALKLLNRVKDVREKALGEEHPDTATVYNYIGMIYRQQKKFGTALKWYEKVLRIRETILGKEHPDTAEILNSIGVVYAMQGKYDEALIWYEKALLIREKVLGEEHQATSESLNNFATIYYTQRNYSKALELYYRVLHNYKKTLGNENPATSATYNNIAVMYYYLGDNSKALACNWKALAAREKIQGKNHPDTAQTYCNIATIYAKIGNNFKSLEFYKKALAIYDNVLGKNHPNTIQTSKSINKIHARMKASS